MTAANPQAFFLLLLLALPLVIFVKRFQTLSKSFAIGKRSAIAYSIRLASFAALVCAAADISWGTRPVLKEQSGLAVSFVFDISYSMTTPDALSKAPGALTRLEAARFFAKELLLRLDDGIPVCIATAKGEGMIAVPLTYDRAHPESFLDALSPSLMSQPGSGIGKGIAAASTAFPIRFAYKRVIIVFTDGDETDSMMREAALEAVRKGVWVYFVGFGSEEQTEITAGDGVTRVKTSLKKNAMERIAEEAANLVEKNYEGMPVAGSQFFEAASRGSAAQLLDALSKNAEDRMTAEIQSVPRRGFFLALAILFLSASVVFSQLQIKKLPRFIRKIFLLTLTALSLSSCSSSIEGAFSMFGVAGGSVQWRRQNYNKAAEDFSKARENALKKQNEILADYALYNLGVTYLAQGNNADALEAFGALFENSSKQIRFASFYNAGIIAANSGEYNQAEDFFKSALVVDPSSVDAKINLEIAQSLYEKSAQQAARELLSASESKQNHSAASRQVFSFLKEMETEQWKSSQNGADSDSSVIDY
jgi:Ca-activated chloride channel family protein